MPPHMSASESGVFTMDFKPAVTTCRGAGDPMPIAMEISATRPSPDVQLKTTGTGSAMATSVHSAATGP
jgi:hypothetical protein